MATNDETAERIYDMTKMYATLKLAGFHAAAHALGDRQMSPETARAWLIHLDGNYDVFLSTVGIPYRAPTQFKSTPKVPEL
jgi:hypothetical protein